MPLGEDIFKDITDEFSSGGSSPPKTSSISKRTPMIEKIFEEVLGRRPSSRELAYYRYGVLKEEDIRKKLLKSDEHKKIIEDAGKLPNLEEELKSVRVSERKLVQRIEDINGESVELRKLLEYKDSLIERLRLKISNPYDLPSSTEKYEEGFEVYSHMDIKEIEKPRKRTFKETLIEIIDIVFK